MKPFDSGIMGFKPWYRGHTKFNPLTWTVELLEYGALLHTNISRCIFISYHGHILWVFVSVGNSLPKHVLEKTRLAAKDHILTLDATSARDFWLLFPH